MARAKKMTTVARTGDRLKQLENLALVLAAQIDASARDLDEGPRVLPQLAKQYRDTVREIEEIKGVGKEDDEIGEILSARKADGKPDAVR